MYFPFPEKRNLSEKVVIIPYFASYFQEQYSNRERVFNCSKLTSTGTSKALFWHYCVLNRTFLLYVNQKF